MEYDEKGNLDFQVISEEGDYLFDEIGSVLKIKEYQETKKELLEALELYYRTFFLGENVDWEEEKEDQSQTAVQRPDLLPDPLPEALLYFYFCIK